MLLYWLDQHIFWSFKHLRRVVVYGNSLDDKADSWKYRDVLNSMRQKNNSTLGRIWF